MKNRQLKQFWIVSFAVFALLLSSIAACACFHHQHQTSAETFFSTADCHHSAEMSEMESSDEGSVSKIDDSCNCVYGTSQPFVAGKSENVKDQKVFAFLPEFPAIKVERKFVEISFEKTEFTAHFYNSNYLKTLTHARAPPVFNS